MISVLKVASLALLFAGAAGFADVTKNACNVRIPCGEFEAAGAPERTLSIKELGDDKVSFSTTGSDGVANTVTFHFAADGSLIVTKDSGLAVRGLGLCLDQVCQISIHPMVHENLLLSQLLTLRFSATGLVMEKLNSLSDGQTNSLKAVYNKK